MPTVEKEGQIGMAAPGLHAPGNRRLVVAGFHARKKAAWVGLRLRVDTELPPFLSNHRPGTGHGWPRFTFYQQGDGERCPVGFHPLVAAFLKAGPLEEFGSDFGIGLPPASTKRSRDFLRVFRDLASHRGP